MRLIKFLVIEVNRALVPGNLRCLSSLLRDIQPHPIQIFSKCDGHAITRVFEHFQRGRSVNSAHEGVPRAANPIRRNYPYIPN